MENTQKYVTYEQFGAVGDGKKDDMRAISTAHAYANVHGLPIKAKNNAEYYIGSNAVTAVVRTDTDWGKARFIIDDRSVEDVSQPLFRVESSKESFSLDVKSFAKDQEEMEIELPCDCFITIEDAHERKYIRYGLNQDKGTGQTDCFVAEKDGAIANQIIWDFPDLTSCIAHPIDEDTLVVKGGIFTTIANQGKSVYNYYSRNIEICRSNTEIVGVTHYIKGEEDHGCPYRGFFRIYDCAFVAVKNCFFTGHKIYETIGSAGLPVRMGTYDIDVYRASDVLFKDCSQKDIHDDTKWGIMGSNFCKNLFLENCTFSRFDAHMGVTNCNIKNCKLGWQCINVIGHGTFVVEDTEAHGRTLINMRDDYGCTWDGDMIIRNCVWYPTQSDTAMIIADNAGNHDFGYVCYMPQELTIENVKVMDGEFAAQKGYDGPAVFADYDPAIGEEDDGRNRPYPYETTKVLNIGNVSAESKKAIRIKANDYSMPGLKINLI